MIAMALLLEPKLVIMDEPTSALDVVAQRSLMRQVEALRHELGFAVLFVTHDMSVVSHFSDRLAVMYAGEVVELDRLARSSTSPSTRTPKDSWTPFPRCSASRASSRASPATPPVARGPARRVSLRAPLRLRRWTSAARRARADHVRRRERCVVTSSILRRRRRERARS